MVRLFFGSTGRERLGLKLAAFAVLALLFAPLGACSFFGDKDTLPPDEPAEKLYNEGLYLMNEKHEYKDASKKFEEVDRQHPYSEWASKALIMTAYVAYTTGKYDDCVTAARRYITLHPGTGDAAYAQYLMAASLYDQIPDASRDQDRTEKALNALNEVIRKYPNTEYAAEAKKKIEVARDNLAAREMIVGRYYMGKRDYTGAINRFKIVVTQYQTTRHVEEALMRLTEAYMQLGILPEAQTAAAVLGHNFPDSPWYKDAYNLVKGDGEPSENQGSWISKAFKKIGIGGVG